MTAIVNVPPIVGDDGHVETLAVMLQDMIPSQGLEKPRAEFQGIMNHELQTPPTSAPYTAKTLLDDPGVT